MNKKLFALLLSLAACVVDPIEPSLSTTESAVECGAWPAPACGAYFIASGSTTTATSSIAITREIGVEPDTVLVLLVSVDNSNSGGRAHDAFYVDDAQGNTWTKVATTLIDPAGPNAGLEAAIFITGQDAGWISDGAITVHVSSNVSAASWVLWDEFLAFGHQYLDAGFGSASTSTTPSVTTSALNSGDTIIAGVAAERGGISVTADADTTNGAWSSQYASSGGSGTSGMTVASQFKIVSANGSQTYNPTLSTAADAAAGWVRFGFYSGGI